MCKYCGFSDEVLEMALDGDLYTTMKDIPYSTAPQEVVTVGNMMAHYNKEKERYSDGKSIKTTISK